MTFVGNFLPSNCERKTILEAVFQLKVGADKFFIAQNSSYNQRSELCAIFLILDAVSRVSDILLSILDSKATDI